MNLSPINNNVAFGKVYAVSGPKGRMNKLEAVLSSDDAHNNKLGYIDATDIYSNSIYPLRNRVDIHLRHQVHDGNKVGFILTDDDSHIASDIDGSINEDTISDLSFNTDSFVNLNKEHIPNFF